MASSGLKQSLRRMGPKMGLLRQGEDPSLNLEPEEIRWELLLRTLSTRPDLAAKVVSLQLCIGDRNPDCAHEAAYDHDSGFRVIMEPISHTVELPKNFEAVSRPLIRWLAGCNT